MTLNVILPHPHIEEHHIKHTAGLLTIGGSLVEILHFLPSTIGLTMLMLGGCIAIYEPYIIKTIHLVIPDEEEQQEETI